MPNEELNPENLTGPQKAAIFLLAMGEEFSTSFFKELDEKNIKKIGRYMAEISYVSTDVLNNVMGEFLNNFENKTNLVVSGKHFLEQIVTKTLDEETAREVFKVMGKKDGDTPFSDLAYISSEHLVNIVKGEHPQTIALIISYLQPEKAAEILRLLPEGMKSDVALRIANIRQVQDDLVNELDEAITKDLSGTDVVTRKFDGIEKLANILNEVDGNTEEYVLSHIEDEDSDLAEKIRQKMFVFEDLIQLDDRGFREILQNVENQELAKALKTASEEMKKKILKNLSERASEMLREDMEAMGPVRLREVEEAQLNMIKTAKRLEASGRLVLGGKGKDDILV